MAQRAAAEDTTRRFDRYRHVRQASAASVTAGVQWGRVLANLIWVLARQRRDRAQPAAVPRVRAVQLVRQLLSVRGGRLPLTERIWGRPAVCEHTSVGFNSARAVPPRLPVGSYQPPNISPITTKLRDNGVFQRIRDEPIDQSELAGPFLGWQHTPLYWNRIAVQVAIVFGLQDVEPECSLVLRCSI